MKFNTYATTESVKLLSDRIDALTILTPHDFNVTINDIPKKWHFNEKDYSYGKYKDGMS